MRKLFNSNWWVATVVYGGAVVVVLLFVAGLAAILPWQTANGIQIAVLLAIVLVASAGGSDRRN